MPPPSERRTLKHLPKKEIIPAVVDPSSSTRPVPPHRIPYVRRTEGYISGDTQQCSSVLRGVFLAHRDNLITLIVTDVESPSEHKPIAQLAHGLDRVLFKSVKFNSLGFFHLIDYYVISHQSRCILVERSSFPHLQFHTMVGIHTRRH